MWNKHLNYLIPLTLVGIGLLAGFGLSKLIH